MVHTDDSFDEELYRALVGVQWHRTCNGRGHITGRNGAPPRTESHRRES